MPEELSPSQAAARLGATTRSVQRWIATGRLPARRVGGRWRVASDAIDVFTSLSADHPPRALNRLFVANRGEIVERIRRTCARLGIEVVAPPTEGDAAVDLLDVEAVVRSAVAAGADAIHPGYGFLAEHAGFASAVMGAGLTWVGPTPDAIATMGDKAAARRLAVRLGVPVLPGYDGADQSDGTLAAEMARIGLPIVVKPAAGGGGKGMRVVRDRADLPDALAGARREARAAFGDDRLILERFLDGPRHVEVQVLFDEHGSGVHLGERDCSIQRRHQKVLEETPSPAVDGALRARLGDAALRLAGGAGYVSAGTCEFLLEDSGAFFFLEMNARLQVEHPVTELVTGRDLVADQLRIATGERLGVAQSAVTATGHAVEVRLYAEDADAGFLPATGRVEALRWPDGTGIRVDAGIELGSEVGARFDPMLAKVIAHGTDRAEALERLARALDETTVLGVTTNLRFLRWLVRQPAVIEGEARIDTLERVWPPPDWPDRSAVPADAWLAAARALTGHAGPWSGGWRLNAPSVVRLSAEGEERTVRLAGEPVATVAVDAGAAAHVDVGGRSVAFRPAPPPDVDRAARAASAAHTGGRAALVAPMPGSVIAVHAPAGTSVAAGDPVVTLEAMKMEHVVTAPADGTIEEILVAPGAQVSRGQALGSVTV